MRPFFSSPIVRLSPRPDDPAAVVGPRPRGSRRPHTDATVATVRRLVELSTLTYGEIAARTGVGRASICRWTRDGGWQRPALAPRATDLLPTARASARLKARMLARRLFALAERAVREQEEAPIVDLDKLAQALELMKMAKLAARPRRRRAPGETPGHSPQVSDDPARTLAGLRAAGVNLEHVPHAALEAFAVPREPPPDDPALRRRGHRSKRNRDHARLLEPY